MVKQFKLLLAAMTCLLMLADAETIDTARGAVEITTLPQRLAVYNIGTLDTLTALGVPVAGAPAERFIDSLNQLPTTAIGSVLHADLEALNRLQPDLIIVGERSTEQYHTVRQIAPTLDLSLGSGGGQNLYQNGIKRLRQLGKLFDKDAKAQQLESDLNQQRDRARQAAAGMGKGMMVLISGRQLSRLSEQSLTGWIIKELQLPTVTDNADKASAITDVEPISFEYIAKHQPAWLLVVNRNSALGKANAISAQTLLDNPLVEQTPAAQNRRIIYLNSADALVPIGGVQAMQRTLAFLTIALENTD